MEHTSGRAQSAEQYMSRTASVLSSWSEQSSRAEELDQRLHSALRQNRERIPEAWFEKQYASVAARDEVVRERVQGRLQSRRARQQEFAASRHRALEHLASDIRPRQQMEREALRSSLERKMSQAAGRLVARGATPDGARGQALLQRKQQHELDAIERREFFASQQRVQDERAVGFQQLAEDRKAASLGARERLQYATAERAERARALQADAQRQREELGQHRAFEQQMLRDKHDGIGDWLTLFDTQKRATLRQRRVGGLASTLQRKAILQSTRNAWHETLRDSPIPDDPVELQQLAQKMTPS